MKPSDFQKTVQCRFESCLKKVVRSVVKDYYKELNRRKNKEISFSELPDVLVDKMAVWDDYETDYTIFSVCGIDIRVLDDELAEALKKLPERKRNTLLMYYFLEMRAIDTVKQSDAKEWAIRMSEKGYAYKTIDNYKRSLKASFYMAIQDDCIRKNPFEFKLSDVLEDDTEQKVILTPEQEKHLLAFMETDKIYSKYYDEVVLLLETGLRISEFCGLTTHIDMQNRILNIDHQLLKDSEMGYYIETPKTKNGKRELPLTERAYQAIQRILKSRGKAQPLIVGGYSNFLFLNREGLPKVAGNYEGMVRGLIKKYNKYHTDKLPNITPHSFRQRSISNDISLLNASIIGDFESELTIRESRIHTTIKSKPFPIKNKVILSPLYNLQNYSALLFPPCIKQK